MLNIALVYKYVAHMGHWPSGFSKNKKNKNKTYTNTSVSTTLLVNFVIIHVSVS